MIYIVKILPVERGEGELNGGSARQYSPDVRGWSPSQGLSKYARVGISTFPQSFSDGEIQGGFKGGVTIRCMKWRIQFNDMRTIDDSLYSGNTLDSPTTRRFHFAPLFDSRGFPDNSVKATIRERSYLIILEWTRMPHPYRVFRTSAVPLPLHATQS